MREPFDAQNAPSGIQLACLKRPVSLPAIEEMVTRISEIKFWVKRQRSSLSRDRSSASKELKKVDDVAYVRFASVYRTFKDVQEFVETLKDSEQFSYSNDDSKVLSAAYELALQVLFQKNLSTWMSTLASIISESAKAPAEIWAYTLSHFDRHRKSN